MKKSGVIFKKTLQVLFHLLFWFGVYFFFTYFLGYGSKNTKYVNRFSLFLMPITIIVSYFFLFFLIPKYLFKKKQQEFLLYTLYTFIVAFFFIVISIFFGLVFSDFLKQDNYTPITKGFIFIILGVYFVVFIAITIGLLINSYKQNLRSEDLKNKFLQTQLQLKEQELKFLKMQIHPHFLFNSLNTIYGFALKKGDEAPEMILKLSNLLDYILYQVEKPTVSLEDELNHLKDYVALEKMRFHDTLKVKVKEKNINNVVQIAPMLLIPFVENSFKHGSIVKGQLKVIICIEIKEGKLFFQISNSAMRNKKNQSGIGLENIKKRLEMLYPNTHKLTISEKENKFTVDLNIVLNGLKSVVKDG